MDPSGNTGSEWWTSDDVPSAFAIGVLVGTLFGGIVFLTDIWGSLAEGEGKRVVATIVGAAASGIVAVWLFAATRAKESRQKKAEAESLRRAAWLDLVLTASPIFDEWKKWASICAAADEEGIGAAATADHHDIEHLHPKVIEALLPSIGRLPADAAMNCLIVNDNLRSIREIIARINGSRAAGRSANWIASDARSCEYMLRDVCIDVGRAIEILDANKRFSGKMSPDMRLRIYGYEREALMKEFEAKIAEWGQGRHRQSTT